MLAPLESMTAPETVPVTSAFRCSGQTKTTAKEATNILESRRGLITPPCLGNRGLPQSALNIHRRILVVKVESIFTWWYSRPVHKGRVMGLRYSCLARQRVNRFFLIGFISLQIATGARAQQASSNCRPARPY